MQSLPCKQHVCAVAALQQKQWPSGTTLHGLADHLLSPPLLLPLLCYAQWVLLC
jgi:hypothetical protein